MEKLLYTKEATTFEEQIELLKKRNIIISDENKAKEYLSDIGYYRLGFYSFPFEITYPLLNKRRKHEVTPRTTIEHIVALYYFDFDLRRILNRYLSRIEVSIRTTMIYTLSLKYKNNPTWFVDPKVLKNKFITNFDSEVYCHIKNKPTIRRHHGKYEGKYAPAWKTMEFMTMGNLEVLYDNLLLDQDKKQIAKIYHEPSISSFKSYLTTIREVRNACAHGNVIFDLSLSKGILAGAACPKFEGGAQQRLNGALKIISYMIRQISTNRNQDMWYELFSATKTLYSKVPSLQPLIEAKTGIIIPKDY